MSDNWTIINGTLQAGEKAQFMADFNSTGIKMPINLINGTSPGKTVLVTSAVHADEYPGIAASIRVAKEIDPSKVCGSIVFCHAVNLSGFWARTRTVSCGANLNANFPGKPDGTEGERIADFFVRTVFPQVDFILDLHSGGMMTPLTPCLFYPWTAIDQVREASLAAARATNIPYLVGSRATAGLYSYAATQMDIPSIMLERGHTGLNLECWISLYEKDIRLVLRHLGSYPFDNAGTICNKTNFEKIAYPAADTTGLWYPAVTENMHIKEGDLLGHMEDFWGNRTAEYHAEGDGVVLYYDSSLSVTAGETLVTYGLNAFAKSL